MIVIQFITFGIGLAVGLVLGLIAGKYLMENIYDNTD